MKNENDDTEHFERREDNALLARKIAVLESIVARAQVDVNELSDLLKEHMLKEEQERRETQAAHEQAMRDISGKLNKLLLKDARLGGIIWTVGIMATAVTAAAGFLIEHFFKSP